MAGHRIRTIKPELLEDAKVARLSCSAFRLFIGCISMADDHGNLRGELDYLRGQVFWGRPEVEVAQVLSELGSTELVHTYRVRAQAYLHVAGWEKHQKIDKPGKPKVPTPAEADPPPVALDLEGDLEGDLDQDRDAREARLFAKPRESSRKLESASPVQLTIADRVDPAPPALPAAPAGAPTPAEEPPPADAPLPLRAFLEALAACSGGRFVVSHKGRTRERRNGAEEALTCGLPAYLWSQLHAELQEERPTLDDVRAAGALLAARKGDRFVFWGQWLVVTADNLRTRVHELLTAAAALAGPPEADLPQVTAEPNTPEYYAQLKARTEARHGR